MAESLIPDNAVLITTDIPDVMARVRITYTGADGAVTVYLSASGLDGAPLLLTY